MQDSRGPGRLTVPGRIRLALRRARFGILAMGAAYGVGVITGLVMVHSGNSFALDYRDKIVADAQKSSLILKQLNQGRPVRAAALDCAGNLVAASATALTGYWAPGPFPIALFRGWIGGIVSVDDKHRSRLGNFPSGFYYVCVMLLQVLPYSLLGGAGVNVGLARAKPVGIYAGPRFLGLPKEALRDAGWIFVLGLPMFAMASAFEFLS